MTKLTKGQPHFRRYTNLAATIDVLLHRRLTLLNTMKWDDRNDAHYLEQYMQHKGGKSILALCFTEVSERYHHWRTFSFGQDGVCIEFRKEKLVAALRELPGVTVNKIDYELLKQMAKRQHMPIDKLPFLKRHAFKDEQEHRILYIDGHEENLPAKCFPIDLSMIESVILNPWLPPSLAASVIEALRLLPGCSDLDIYQSDLLDNPEWKEAAVHVRAGLQPLPSII